MDEDFAKLFLALIIGGVVCVGLVVAGWAYENHAFVTGGYCERALLGTQKTVWEKCAPESGKP